MGAMRGGKGVVHEGIGQPGQPLGQGGVVLLLARVVAGVLEQQDAAIGQRGGGGLGLWPDAVIGPDDGAAEGSGQGFHHGLQRHLRHALALGAVEMAADDNARALFGQFADGGRQALDPRAVGDPPVAHGHVQVSAQQHPLAAGVEAIEGAEAGHQLSPQRRRSARGRRCRPSRRRRAFGTRPRMRPAPRPSATPGAPVRGAKPSARGATLPRPRPASEGIKKSSNRMSGHSRPNRAAVSDIRLLKPHSLSYQDSTRTSPPSTTWVWVASKVLLCGSWLKSMETSGSVL